MDVRTHAALCPRESHRHPRTTRPLVLRNNLAPSMRFSAPNAKHSDKGNQTFAHQPTERASRTHLLVLDGVYQRSAGEPLFHEVGAPSSAQLHELLERIITRIMKWLTLPKAI